MVWNIHIFAREVFRHYLMFIVDWLTINERPKPDERWMHCADFSLLYMTATG